MFRTPAKSQHEAPAPATDKTFNIDTSPKRISKVRKSIGDWEAGNTEEKDKDKDKRVRSPQKTADTETAAKRMIQTKITKVAEQSQSQPLPAKKYLSNQTEAKACLIKIKECLNNSRNTKTELKQDIKDAADRLYQLFLEAEQKKEQGSKVRKEQVEEKGEKETEMDQRRRETDIITKMEKYSELLKENNAKMEELNNNLKKHAELKETYTYASVAAGGTRRLPSSNQATHSVAVTSSDEMETGEQVLEKIRKAVNAKDEGLKVDSIRKGKDRKVIVGCSTEVELNKIKDRLRGAGSDLKVADIKNKDPLVVLQDILKVHEDKDIVQAIRRQNRDLLSGLKEEDLRMEVRYRKRARNELTCHVVLRVSPTLWRRMTDAEAVHVDLQRVRVADQSPLVQCSKCLGYGHTKRLCTESVEVCSHCAGPHLRTECSSWLSGEPPSCRNCHKARSDRKDHSAFSVDCPANLQRSELCTAELINEASKRKLALALVQEPYIGRIGEMRQRPGIRIVQCAGNRTAQSVVKSAIVLFDDTIDVSHCPDLTTCNIAVAKVRTAAWEIGVVSVYLEPDKPIEPYLDQIGSVVDRLGMDNVILGGDLNAWCTDWGSQKTDARGLEVAGKLDELGLQLLNEGSEPTFDTIRGSRRFCSCVDITACTTSLLGRVVDWRLADVTSSDHRAILFSLNLRLSVGMDIRSSTREYNTRKANWSEFRSKLASRWQERGITPAEIEGTVDRENLERQVDRYVETVVDVCEETMPKIGKRRRTGLPWWSEKLSDLKAKVLRYKRRVRCAAQVRREWVVQQYVDAKDEYLREVRRAQTESWKSFCGRQTRESMWDGIYRVIGRTTKRSEDIPLVRGGTALGGEESARVLAETFFPEDSLGEDDAAHTEMRRMAETVNGGSHSEVCDPPFTRHELMWAASSFNPKKAPGPDGLTADICLAAITLDPELFLAIANRCLALACFPRRWKEAVVAVLRKPNKEDYTHPRSYRPIGLLPIMGKVLEKMLVRRVRWYTAPMISRHQYGFMPQRGTEDSLYDMIQHIRAEVEKRRLVVLISLDIEGAFDNAWWPAVRCSLAETRCPVNLRRLFDHYFSERIVRVRYAGSEWARKPTKGCVQGSIGGPTLWNLLLNPLLVELGEMGVRCQAFADDVVLMFSGNSTADIQGAANVALDHVQGWGVRNKLKFAAHKTRAMVFTRKRKYDSPRLSMGGGHIELVTSLKILGLTVDDRLTFNKHIQNVAIKVQKLYRQLSTAARISWGLNPEVIRTIYVAVVEPIVLYAASVWAPAARKKTTQKLLDRVQRGFAQKIVRAYRTVSLNAAVALAGLLPLDLRVQEAALLYEVKKGHSQRVLRDRDLERPTKYEEAEHPAHLEGLQFDCLTDGDEVAQRATVDVRIYTDGSKIDGRVGAALSIWDGAAETSCRKLKLGNFCTVYQAELYALYEAVKFVVRSPSRRFGIYSDSRSALESLRSIDSLHPLVGEIRRMVKGCVEAGKEVRLNWIKAHVGVEGNERADQLAKQAAVGVKTKPHYDKVPVSFVKRQLRLDSLDEWNRRYKEGVTASTTRVFFPDAISAYPVLRKLELDPVLVQVLTGHGGFAEYLHRFKCKTSPSCICDPARGESVLHAIVECPVFGRKRVEFETATKEKISLENINNLIRNKESRTKFIEYCKEIANKIIDRNRTQ
ncbi:uncharacterized protein LOC123721737 [Papilio machaon]|uniref:uncharacterized protein LOC123721737 n=1 Tax=Papilio machaon TaxID=76193 RepID=UPI001E6646CB|nr:uncharacterized protein LOC123721737 [Papilio machaon]